MAKSLIVTLYRLANMEAVQMRVPMKRAALLLSFIKGPNVDDWVQQRTNEILDRFNQTGDQLDEIYWTSLGQQFMDTFWDTASRERAETKLRGLSWIPRDVDTFIVQFRSLAEQAQYALDDCPTIMLFASKFPFKMMQHIFLIVKPVNFNGWADAARCYVFTLFKPHHKQRYYRTASFLYRDPTSPHSLCL